MKLTSGLVTILLVLAAAACSKSGSPATTPPTTDPPASFTFNTLKVNGTYKGLSYTNVNPSPVIQLSFLAPLDHTSVNNAVTLKTTGGAGVNITTTFANNDSTLVIQPATPLLPITKYTLSVSTALQSQSKGALQTAISVSLLTSIDSTDKFPRISDDALLDKVQAQTLKYFWDFGHPVSGLARERSSSGDVVTSGGSGFGIMALLVAAQRGFLSHSQSLNRIDTIVNFLTNKASRFHGAFSHWINGSTGATVPFGTQDNGGDIVETSYMIQGLLCARQFFNSTTDAKEINLRDKINAIWNGVDWSWFRRDGKNILYWNWSPDYDWAINVPVKGWNEALITYVLAASAPVNTIPKTTYDSGWAGNGSIRNGTAYYGITLPLGPGLGGPLFFAHYSFLGIDPRGLSDAYANYWSQDTAHTRINYKYCVANPQGFYGYSDQCWGLTASDNNGGYAAHSPTNDLGVIAPTAAISSIPYTPIESMNAIRFFYYTLGDKAWGQYGFTDAFSLANPWFDTDCLAIDQGPEIVMIENYRSGLLWNLFMSCPEVQSGMKKLGFQSPHF